MTDKDYPLSVDQLLELKDRVSDPETWMQGELTDQKGKYCVVGHVSLMLGYKADQMTDDGMCDLVDFYKTEPVRFLDSITMTVYPKIQLEDEIISYIPDGIWEVNDALGNEAVCEVLDEAISVIKDGR